MRQQIQELKGALADLEQAVEEQELAVEDQEQAPEAYDAWHALIVREEGQPLSLRVGSLDVDAGTTIPLTPEQAEAVQAALGAY